MQGIQILSDPGDTLSLRGTQQARVQVIALHQQRAQSGQTADVCRQQGQVVVAHVEDLQILQTV